MINLRVGSSAKNRAGSPGEGYLQPCIPMPWVGAEEGGRRATSPLAIPDFEWSAFEILDQVAPSEDQSTSYGNDQ